MMKYLFLFLGLISKCFGHQHLYSGCDVHISATNESTEIQSIYFPAKVANLASCDNACLNSTDCTSFSFNSITALCRLFTGSYTTLPKVSAQFIVSGIQGCTDNTDPSTVDFCPSSSGEAPTWSGFGPCNETTNLRTMVCKWCNINVLDEQYCRQGSQVAAKTEACRVDVLLYGGGSTSNAEVIPFGASANKICPSPQSLPADLGQSAAFMNGRTPVVCGMSNCVYLDEQSLSWEPFEQNLTDMREYPNVVKVGLKTWFIGGTIKPKSINTTEYFDETDQMFHVGPTLDHINTHGCAAAINNTHYIIAGGISYEVEFGRPARVHTKQTFIVNTVNNDWTEVGNISNHKAYSSCGIVRYNGKTEFVVAGGVDLNNLIFYNTSEILDMDTLQWRDGPTLDFEFAAAPSVPYGDTFLLIGGLYVVNYENFERNTIVEYDPETPRWVTRPETTATNASFAFALSVEDSYFGCSTRSGGFFVLE